MTLLTEKQKINTSPQEVVHVPQIFLFTFERVIFNTQWFCFSWTVNFCLKTLCDHTTALSHRNRMWGKFRGQRLLSVLSETPDWAWTHWSRTSYSETIQIGGENFVICKVLIRNSWWWFLVTLLWLSDFDRYCIILNLVTFCKFEVLKNQALQ